MVTALRIVLRLTALLVVLLTSSPAVGQDARRQPRNDAEKIAEAKELFRKGVELFEAKDTERALELFLRSREVFPSVQNTSNAAICLDELGRYDEALELYEQVLTEFKDELTDRAKESIGPAMAKLREKVGSLWVSANVEGSVVVDGRARAELPLTIPIRVLPGTRVVRVLEDGYVTFEKSVVIEPKGTTRVEAKLEPLRDAGLLRIEDRGASGSEVFVDGAKMGRTPWEGTLGPGAHLVWTANADMGSAPKEVVVVQGQKAVVEITSAPLGAPRRIAAKPETAVIEIDGVEVAKGSWRGRLPLGGYAVRAHEQGYHPATQSITVDDRQHPSPVTFELEVDEDHPRWPKGAEGALYVEAGIGYALGATLGSGAEQNCASCPSAPLVHGLNVTARGGYRFAPGISLELVAGYIRLHSSFERTLAGPGAPYADLSYALADSLLVHGPFGGFGIGYRVPFGSFAFDARVMGGAMLAAATDDVAGNASTGGESASVVVRDDDPVARAGTIFVQADVGLAVVVGSFDIGLSLAGQAFLLDGPVLDARRLDVPYACEHDGDGGVGCIESGVPLEDEVAHSTFFLGSPQLRVSYSF